MDVLDKMHLTLNHYLLRCIFVISFINTFSLACAAPGNHEKNISSIKKGTFLLATKNLNGSSFDKSVILITHYSKSGATGLAINRSSEISLNQAFPNIKQLQHNQDKLFLGGPVRSQSIFILMKTKRPQQNMQNIADDVYFAPGMAAFSNNKTDSNTDESVRAFAGYAGWAAGQLEYEIRRGDWVVVQSKLDIIFSEDFSSLWNTLHRTWSGTWI